MLYLLAIVFPPVAVLLCRKPVEAFLSVLMVLILGYLLGGVLGRTAFLPPLMLVAWLPGILHAVLVVNSHHADTRTDRVVCEIRAQTKAAPAAVAATSESELAFETGRAELD